MTVLFKYAPYTPEEIGTASPEIMRELHKWVGRAGHNEVSKNQCQAHLFVLLWTSSNNSRQIKSLEVHGRKEKLWIGNEHNHILYYNIRLYTSCSTNEQVLLQEIRKSRNAVQLVNPHRACMQPGDSLPSTPWSWHGGVSLYSQHLASENKSRKVRSSVTLEVQS